VKHSVPITAILVSLFIAAQVVGLGLLAIDIDAVDVIDGGRVVQHGTTALGDRPPLSGAGSFWYLVIGVAIGTAIVLLLIRLRAFRLWKVWFFLAVALSLAVAFGVIVPRWAALLMGVLLAFWKVSKPNPVVHNLTEIFMYAGIAILLVPLFSFFWICMTLVVISVYDMIAVWYSKHMVTMAQEQTKAQLFAGLYVPKRDEPTTQAPISPAVPAPTRTIHTTTHAGRAHPVGAAPDTPVSQAASKQAASHKGAILGGGDIAFPLLFSGVVMETLIMRGLDAPDAFMRASIITLTSALALTLLFVYAKKDRFYPAMPFLSAGCALGAIIALWI
jgi:presenilin-like A22 family membrane protease